jgi:hypothetical protein
VLIAQARFCATCGSPVTRGSVPPAPAPRKSVAASVPDPFAQTMLRDDVVAAAEAAPAAPISPMAASLMNNQNPPAPAQSPANRPAAAYAPPPSPAASPGPAQVAPQAPQQTHNIAPGTLVLVYWADGQRYPGTVLQVGPHHVFVAFPNGIQQWIDARYVTVGG